MKKSLFGLLTLLVFAPIVHGQVEVSIEGDYVHFNRTKTGRTFIAPINAPTELAAVHISYPKRDFSEYVIALGQYFPTERDRRYASVKEWKKLSAEWQQIQRQVTFGRIEGSVVVDKNRRYTFIGTTVDDAQRLMHVFKVFYTYTGKEGIEVLDYNLFKVHPASTAPSFLGRENGRLMPVAIPPAPDDMSTR